MQEHTASTHLTRTDFRLRTVSPPPHEGSLFRIKARVMRMEYCPNEAIHDPARRLPRPLPFRIIDVARRGASIHLRDAAAPTPLPHSHPATARWLTKIYTHQAL